MERLRNTVLAADLLTNLYFEDGEQTTELFLCQVINIHPHGFGCDDMLKGRQFVKRLDFSVCPQHILVML